MASTIEINTTQNVTIEYELAGLFERALAWLIDALILGFSWIILYQIVRIAFPNLSDTGSLIYFILCACSFFLYHILFEILNLGQTPGKKTMNIRIVRLDGKDPEWGDVVIRAVMQIIDTLSSIGIIGSILILTTNNSQRFGDMGANTTAIKIFSSKFLFSLTDILNIASLQNYKPVYPQVRNLTETDMLFIKNVLSRQSEFPNSAHHFLVEDLVSRLMTVLEIDKRPLDRIDFLKTLLRDYVVLTR
jgi:uncharacterized RDD family membrane protein YckC